MGQKPNFLQHLKDVTNVWNYGKAQYFFEEVQANWSLDFPTPAETEDHRYLLCTALLQKTHALNEWIIAAKIKQNLDIKFLQVLQNAVISFKV